MARKMSKAPTQAYRAVVVWEFASGGTHTEYLGPYWTAAAAKARVSSVRRSSGWRTVKSAHIETAPLGDWEAL